jgi:hypothetical protein
VAGSWFGRCLPGRIQACNLGAFASRFRVAPALLLKIVMAIAWLRCDLQSRYGNMQAFYRQSQVAGELDTIVAAIAPWETEFSRVLPTVD